MAAGTATRPRRELEAGAKSVQGQTCEDPEVP
jgi:hypothetical protein